MEPLIRHGDWVTVSTRVEPAEGDVAVAWPPEGEIVCHRVLRRAARRAVLLAGDRSRSAGYSEPQDILGRVESVERGDLFLTLRAPGRTNGLLTRLHASSVALDEGRNSLPWRIFEALRRRLRSAYSSWAWFRSGWRRLHDPQSRRLQRSP